MSIITGGTTKGSSAPNNKETPVMSKTLGQTTNENSLAKQNNIQY